MAATVIALPAEPGDESQASALSLPAATTTVTPSATSFVTRSFSAWLNSPVRLMFTTAGTPERWWDATQSSPATAQAEVPDPLQSSTRTGTSVTPFATP